MTTIPSFVQIHTLHSHPAALLNRDDTGAAKRMPFGGASRLRISSQCLKRHWRVAEDIHALHNIAGAEEAVRSRDVIDQKVIKPLREEGVASDEVLTAMGESLNVGVYGANGKQLASRQPLLLGRPEVEYLKERARAIAAEHSADPEDAVKAVNGMFNAKGEGVNFQAFRQQAKLPGGLTSALFGRMVTSDPAANITAAVHVSHSLTVHSEETEVDYFTVLDDILSSRESAQAAHVSSSELSAGLFYGYVVIDVPGLISNLEGCPREEWQQADPTMASAVLHHLTHLIATVSPGAKLGATAPYSYAEFMLVEAGQRQPRTLCNAFRTPIEPRLPKAVNVLRDYVQQLDTFYGPHENRRLACMEPVSADWDVTPLTIPELARWTADMVLNAGTRHASDVC